MAARLSCCILLTNSATLTDMFSILSSVGCESCAKYTKHPGHMSITSGGMTFVAEQPCLPRERAAGGRRKNPETRNQGSRLGNTLRARTARLIGGTLHMECGVV